MNWYYAIEGRSTGPVSENNLKRLAREGTVHSDTLVWHPGLDEWKSLAELNPAIAEKALVSAEAVPVINITPPVSVPAVAGPEGAGKGFFKRFFGGSKN